jgi:hypothetical protein
MKTLGGLLGMLGGLFGMLALSTYFFFGASGRIAALGVLGEIAAFTCIVASMAVLVGPGRRAGLCLLAAGLIDMLIGLFVGPTIGGSLVTPAIAGGLLVAPAVIGGVLAATHGRSLPAAIPPRHEW